MHCALFPFPSNRKRAVNIHEYQAKELLVAQGIPVPMGEVATTPEQAEQIARRLGGMTVIKAQVHTGGRGKAGGVKLAKTPEDAICGAPWPDARAVLAAAWPRAMRARRSPMQTAASIPVVSNRIDDSAASGAH